MFFKINFNIILPFMLRFSYCSLSFKPAGIANDRPILSSERKFHKEYESKYSVEKNAGCESQGAWGQDELIGGKPPVVK
jgi:hypothetical protein